MVDFFIKKYCMHSFYFATLLDKNYISRASVMINSLQRNSDNNIHFFILSLDNYVVDFFSKNSNVSILNVADLEYEFPELLEAKMNRSKVEYLFTLSPFLPLYILLKNKQIDRITTLDSDLFFLSDPIPFIKDLGHEYIGITQHGYGADLIHLNNFGKFNVSFQSFPNTSEGISCLSDWGVDCIDYCGDKVDQIGRFGDQKYLDNWEIRYKNVVNFPIPYIGLAPWNVKYSNVTFSDNKFTLNDKPILFYHFHKFKLLNNKIFIHGLHYFNVNTLPVWLKVLYSIYWFELRKAELFKNFKLKITSTYNDNRFSYNSLIKSLLQFAFGIEAFGKVFFFNFRKYSKYYLLIKNKI